MHAPRLVTAALVVTGLSVLGAAPAQAAQVNHPIFRESFEDVACDIAVHVDVFAANPVVLKTGRLTEAGYPESVDTGHLQVRLTNTANGRWMEDDFSGPAMIVSAVVNPDGSQTKRVVFDGTKRIFKAWDGAVVADRGRLIVDYLISADDEIVSRTLVSQVGDFPIASGKVSFCDFAQAHLA